MPHIVLSTKEAMTNKVSKLTSPSRAYNIM